MTAKLVEEVLQEMEHTHSAKRLAHIRGVIECAQELAQRFGQDPQAARIAAAFHDYAKAMPLQEMRDLANRLHVTLDSMQFQSPELLHGKIAAALAKERFSVQDRDILRAIEYHTTGRENMSDLEKIVMVADRIEPSRNFQGVERLRAYSAQDLDLAVREALAGSIIELAKSGKRIHPLTIGAYNSLLDRPEEAIEVKNEIFFD